jgi:protoporphyrinogen oxidase
MKVAVLGAGISGLSCAWLLKQQGIDATVYEARDHIGGLARSFGWHDFSCDFASHRLFTLDETVLRRLLALVPMGRHVRRSRIYLGGKSLHDPINTREIALRFNALFTSRLLWPYIARPRNLPDDSFYQYVIRRYGRALNDFVFRPYTERLFGISGDEISAEWARNKIRLAVPLDNLRGSSKKKGTRIFITRCAAAMAPLPKLCILTWNGRCA